MTKSCFICNIFLGDKEPPDLFTEYTTIDESVATLLSEIVDKPVSDRNVHSCVVCKHCYATCLEYDISKKRMQEIKREITNAFKITLPKHGYEYNTYPKKLLVTPRKLVVPASKLQPLPANYVIDVSKIPKNLNIPSSPTLNLKVTTSPKVLTQSINSNRSSPLNPQTVTTDKAVESNIANSLSSILGVKTSTSVSPDSAMLTFNVNSMPMEFLNTENNVKEEASDVDDEEEDDDDDDDINNDEQPMEIDEECTMTKIASKEREDSSQNETDESEKQFFDVSLLPVEEGATNDTIMGKLQILDKPEDEDDDDDDENEGSKQVTMTDESGSVIRFMMSGQRLVYENGTLTLADDNAPSNEHDDDDSNDEEAQIELQVSGDEETANAIIAAAQEQGGAFIKVESGEMFRVKSVVGQRGTSPPPVQMVDIQGGAYHCLLCQNSKVSESDSPSKKSSVMQSADDIMTHLRTEHDARLYICRYCNKILRKRNEYQEHLRSCNSPSTPVSVVTKSKVHECSHCTKKFTSRTLLQEHMNVHTGARPYSCPVCKKTFSSKYTHQTHLKTHMDRPRPFKCNQCPKSFLTQQNLNQHEKTHLGIKDFVCGTCGKAFSTQHNLEVHYVVHSKSKPFMCGICGKPFARRAEVKDHMRIHTGERPFACDICSATFTQRSNLNSHKRATHMDDKRYHCEECPKRFKRRRLLDYHMKVSHTGERPLECDICHARFVYPEHYKKHARIHSGEKPFVCEVCGKSFNSRDNRNTHRFVHSDKKPYECLVCGAGFMRKQLLYTHMNTSGHLAESIVVNQPRVQKVGDRGSRLKTDNKIEMLFETQAASEELEASNGDKNEEVVVTDAAQDATKYIIQDGKGTINLVQETDDPALLTLIQNLDGSKTDSIQTITAEQLSEPMQVVTSDENGAIRVVQLHIGAHNGVWVTSTP